MPTEFAVRRATVTDAPVIARHRAEMFTDMGSLPGRLYNDLVTATTHYLEQTMAVEEYVGWLASSLDKPEAVVAGAGILHRRVPPHPHDISGRVELAHGRQGIVLNVFTERAWRRRGLADVLMRHVLEWAANSGLETLVLHASEDGRYLYERLGFVATNEMGYRGALSHGCASSSRPGGPDS